ncbi:MAG: hypothetical protein ACO1O1_01535 [Adhaeribacter sp.]
MLDPNTPVLQLGPQISFRRFAFSGEFGFTFPALEEIINKRYDSLFMDQRLHKIRLEAKCYLGPDKASGFFQLNPYIGLEGFWVSRRFRRYNEFIDIDTERYHFTYSDMSRDVQGACLKFGLEPVVYKRWSADVFGGLGVRQLSITHQAQGLSHYRESILEALFSAERADRREGTYYRPHLALGWKIAFALR